jgi:hypothetical protein
MKTFLQTIILLQSILFLTFYEVNAQTFNWAKSISNAVGTSISTDADGNSYITGNFFGVATFGTIQLTSYGSMDVFIAKYDSSGNFIWVKQAGGGDNDGGLGIAVDANKNSYVTGYFSGIATFGTNQFNSVGGNDIFLAKYDANGNFLWAKQMGGIYSDWGYGISIDPDGNAIFTGRFIGPITFGTIQLNGYGSWDAFIAKYDKNGNCIWAKQAGSTATDEGYGISIDQKGKSFVTGRFLGTATFGTIQLTSYGGADIFVAMYDTNGNCLWAKHGGSVNTDRGVSISVDANDNSYTTGWFKGTATFDTVQLNGYGNNDIFIAKYDPYGNLLWAKQAGGSNDDVGNSISADPNGNSYITGSFIGNITIGTFLLNGDLNNTNDLFVAKYDSKGICLWAQKAGGNYNDMGNSIYFNAKNKCYLTGSFSDTGSFGPHKLTGGGAFITQISNETVPVELSSFTGTIIHNTVKLEWITITETNNNYFNVERKSQNGLWKTIGVIKGAGNSLIPIKYSYIDKDLLPKGDYLYRLKQIDYNGEFKYSGEIKTEINFIPGDFSLQQNYPNPFNPNTIIRFTIPNDSYVQIIIYNPLGEIIKEIVSGYKPQGNYEISFDASSLTSGVYLYLMKASTLDGKKNFSESKKMLFLK